MESLWKPKELTVEERRKYDELMECVKDGSLPPDEYEKKLKKLGEILYDPEQDYFTDLIKDYKEAYNRWQNKQGAPNSFFYDQVDMELAYLENCLIDTERIIEKESKLNPSYDRTTSNPIISKKIHIDNAIRYLQSIEGELKNAMRQQVQSDGSQIPDSPPPQATETKITAYLKSEGYIAKEPSGNGKYDLSDNANNTIHRFMYNNYQKDENWNFLVTFLDKYTNHNCTIETLKRYVREAKKIVPKQLNDRTTIKNLRKSI